MTDAHEWRSAPTAQYAVVGDPVAHSLSPRMQNAAFRAHGLADEYVALRVPLEEFDEAMEHLASIQYIGVNVTVPLKTSAFRWAATTPDLERRMGVVNTLRVSDREAINTDAPGLLDVINSLDVETPCRLLLLGAGGTAQAFLISLVDAGFEVACWNRTRERIVDVVEQRAVPATVLDVPDPGGCQIIVNATSASMAGESLPVLWDRAPEGVAAVDVFYTDGPTVFQSDAQRYGVQVAIDGRALLVAQGALSFEWWTGKSAPREAMLKAIQ